MEALSLAVAVYATLLVVRFGFLNIVIYLIRAIDRRPQQRSLPALGSPKPHASQCDSTHPLADLDHRTPVPTAKK